jgi:glycosyltransferase involved in cell wall biosynthesis
MSAVKVAMVTTWGDQCGISTYSEELCECLMDEGARVLVLAPLGKEGSCMSPPEGIPFQGCWDHRSPEISTAILSMTEGIDIIHFQHEHGIFPNPIALFQTLTDLRKAGKKIVITLHTVWQYGTWRGSGFLDTVRSLADVVIVHTPEAYASMSLAQGGGAVWMTPHGARTVRERGDRARGLKALEVPEKYWEGSFCGSLGFMGPNKLIHVTMKAFAEAMARGMIKKSSVFLAFGECKTPQYHELLRAVRYTSGYYANIFIKPSFIPRKNMHHAMAALDFAVLNTDADTLSSSGALCMHASHGVPLAVANMPIYHAGIAAGAVPFDVTGDDPDQSLVNAIAALANSKSMRTVIAQSLLRYAKTNSWNVIAERHIKMYEKILE